MVWADEGIECYVLPKPRKGYKALYWVKEGSQYRFVTSPPKVKRARRSKRQPSCYIKNKKGPEHVALNEMYNPETGDYLYTTSPDEVAYSRDIGYKDTTVIGYVWAEQDKETKAYIPLYRAYARESRRHFYTTNVEEIDDRCPRISRDALRKLLKDELGRYLEKGESFKIGDEEYFCPTVVSVQKIIDNAKVDHERYVPDYRDCDDFAHLLKSAFIKEAREDTGRKSKPYAVGILWGKEPDPHALNFVVVNEGRGEKENHVKIIEPQLGVIFTPSRRVLDKIHLAVC